MPAWVMVPMCALLVAVTFGRLIFVRGTPVDYAVTTFIAAAAGATVFRPAGWAGQVGGATGWVLYLVHVACMTVTFAAVFWLLGRWKGGSRARVIERAVILGAVAVVLGLVLLAIPMYPAPGPFQRVSPGWWCAAFNVLYCVPGVAAGAAAASVQVWQFPDARTFLARASVIVIVVVSLGAVVDMGSLAVAAVMEAGGARTPFTEDAAVRAFGGSLPVYFGVASLVLVPGLVAIVGGKLGLDRTSRESAELEAMWRDLTAVIPGLVLELSPRDRWYASSHDRLLCRLAEIQDVIGVLGPWRTVPGDEPAEAVAADLMRAAGHYRDADRYARDALAEGLPVLDAEQVGRVGRVWAQTRDRSQAGDVPAIGAGS